MRMRQEKRSRSSESECKLPALDYIQGERRCNSFGKQFADPTGLTAMVFLDSFAATSRPYTVPPSAGRRGPAAGVQGHFGRVRAGAAVRNAGLKRSHLHRLLANQRYVPDSLASGCGFPQGFHIAQYSHAREITRFFHAPGRGGHRPCACPSAVLLIERKQHAAHSRQTSNIDACRLGEKNLRFRDSAVEV